MFGTHLFPTALFLALASAQIRTPPANVSSGFVRPTGPRALALGGPEPASLTSWFYTPNGLVVVDGDIIYGTVDDFNRAVINTTYNSENDLNVPANLGAPTRRDTSPQADAVAKRSNSLFPNSAGLWPSGKISFRYADDQTEQDLSSFVEAATDIWAKAVPCLSFTKVPNGIGGSDPIVTISANVPNQGYCLASLGYSPFGTFMQLDTGGGCGIPELVHEWGRFFQASY